MHVKSFQNPLLLGFFLHGLQPCLAQIVPPERCATGVHAILIRGQGPGDHLNVMVSVQNLILQLIPGSSSVDLPYKHGVDDHRIAAADGASLMQEYIRYYAASCPNSKIFVHGYSLGGVVMMDGLCGTSSQWLFPVSALEPRYNRTVIAAVSYGEETFVPGVPYSVGTCTDGTGTSGWYFRLVSGIYPRIHPEWCDAYAASLRSYCDEDDATCCFRIPPPDNLAHFLYIFRYNMDVLHFVQQRLNATRSQ
ncbi:uncharacterized protein N7482_005406 [Penicillium canariense]|uniref:Uncharacterized protein n=1 Tax=Penicillium canariense TaxID=189055 RepID=A0A9W9I4U0_9EURO|nr:uncharacterized protein N7482_005406 [Penicillium canariense]KAJ5166625.1 hypothetical protein N7482_005406 [Penicillium canariense]